METPDEMDGPKDGILNEEVVPDGATTAPPPEASGEAALCEHCHQELQEILTTFPEQDSHVAAAADEATTIRELLGNRDPDREGLLLVLDDFAFFDKQGHIVPLDLLDAGVLIQIYGSGKLTVFEKDGGDKKTLASSIGPLTGWWISAWDDVDASEPDEGAVFKFAVSTEAAQYELGLPDKLYAEAMTRVVRKASLARAVLEQLLEGRLSGQDVSYESLVRNLRIQDDGSPATSQEEPTDVDALLARNARFILRLVDDFAGPDDGDEAIPLKNQGCTRHLFKLAGLEVPSPPASPPLSSSESTSGSSSPSSSRSTSPLPTPLVRRTRSVPKKYRPLPEAAEAQLHQQPVMCATSKEATFVKATTTPLVREVFEDFFANQISLQVNQSLNEDNPQGDQVGGPLSPQKNDDKPLAPEIQPLKSSPKGPDTFEDEVKANGDDEAVKRTSLKWVGTGVEKRVLTSSPPQVVTYYSGVTVVWSGDQKPLMVNDFVMLGSAAAGGGGQGKAKRICRIMNLFEKNGEPFAHLLEYVAGKDTILGETVSAGEKELFELKNSCFSVKLISLQGRVSVTHWRTPSDVWARIGGTRDSLRTPASADANNSYYYRLSYEPTTARFESAEDHTWPDPAAGDEEAEQFLTSCPVCELKMATNVENRIKPFDRLNPEAHALSIKKWKGFVYESGVAHRVGDAVYLNPKLKANSGFGGLPDPSGAAEEAHQPAADLKRSLSTDLDEDKYPEAYRKSGYVKGANEGTGHPFDIGIIVEVYSPMASMSHENLRIRVRNLYRPYQLEMMEEAEAFGKDLNLVYWSDDTRNVEASAVRGKCFVLAKASLDRSAEQWTVEGEHRFYFDEAYSRQTKRTTRLPQDALDYRPFPSEDGDGSLPVLETPLRGLDVFAGCGGLSCGLKQSGVSHAKWAIEVCQPAAEAYQLNEPDCEVFTDDCNLLLKLVMDDCLATFKDKKLPQKGEVELLCGGPPCQGFSGMNRFNQGEYSQFKNSLISTYLSYCDFYRPKYFILENVRNFASFKSSMVLKLCLRALVRMGYQCTFGVLQAGHYGVAQTRRRCILLAAAPSEKLPLYPEPLHVFAKVPLSVTVGGDKYVTNCRWLEAGAPYRTITVRDSMSDLPEIESGCSEVKQQYRTGPKCHFQRLTRQEMAQDELLSDHVCKEMSSLVNARMSMIPTTPGADWRDLPNVVMLLSDGTFTEKLEYGYNDVEKGKGRAGRLRGVCQCAQFKVKKNRCNVTDKQTNTLIPWCLPHTSNRHNNWAGLYGRVAWDGFFSTTVTNPEPMGKQGRVLHPQQHRLVSVRECARSQGFPDHFQFSGNIVQKHRQVGNAVPPPMGKAIGLEILKAAACSRRRATSGQDSASGQIGATDEPKEVKPIPCLKLEPL